MVTETSFPYLTDSLRLLLSLLGGNQHSPLSTWEHWVRHSDWINRPVDQRAYELLPQVYQRLSSEKADFPDRDRLKGVYRRRWYSQALLDQLAENVFTSLDAEKIPFVLIGAAAHDLVSYPAGMRRFFHRLNLLVPAGSIGSAASLVEANGWTSTARSQPAHTVTLTHPSGGILRLRANSTKEHRLESVDSGLRQRSRPASGRVKVPSPADLLLLTCLHGWGPPSRWSILWIADACMLLDNRRVEIDWDVFLREGRNRSVSFRLAACLDFLISTFNAAVPEEAFLLLRANPAAWFEEREARLVISHPWGLSDRLRFAYFGHIRQHGPPRSIGWWTDLVKFTFAEAGAPRGLAFVNWFLGKALRKLKNLLRRKKLIVEIDNPEGS